MDDTLIQMLRFASKGYACSQIMVLLALDKCKDTNPALIRAMAGLAYGCGNGAATCGVLTGACCVIGYFAGKGSDEEPANEDLLMMLEELIEWFQNDFGQRYGGISCQAIVGESGPQASRSTCANILSATYSRTVEILSGHG
ncbi:MAG: C-GCAxxG-C-C family protein, partial [Desulfobacterales bacterium]|nr:C-GCAxxG-C-C family protein [Desulfobacterales bacterium]